MGHFCPKKINNFDDQNDFKHIEKKQFKLI